MEENRTVGMEDEEARCTEPKWRVQQTLEQIGTLIQGLPNEIAISCIARVPRSNYLNMSGVCRSWRNLLHGTVLSEVRCRLSLAEEWLYVWTETQNEWRCRDLSLKKWTKLPPMPDDNRIAGHSAFASFDGKVFVIGGYFLSLYNTRRSYVPCRTVSYFDSRSYCWKTAADLIVARGHCMVGIIENQLYVFGGDIEGFGNTTVTAEVYDAAIDTWKFVSSMTLPMKMRHSVVWEGKFYGVGYADPEGVLWQGVVYDAKTDNWESMAYELCSFWVSRVTFLNTVLLNEQEPYFPEVIKRFHKIAL